MELDNCVIVSPHFDDAVMSCGSLVARHPGTQVTTVFSGRPGPGVTAHSWDKSAGFATGDEATLARHDEDRNALEVLGARQGGLGFLDGPYRDSTGRCHEDPAMETPLETALPSALADLVDEWSPEVLVVPLGLWHDDHIATGRASRALLTSRPECTLIAYADLPYAITRPALVGLLVDELRGQGVRAAPFQVQLPVATTRKGQAVDRYRSQFSPLLAQHPRWRECLALDAERYFRLRRA